MQSANFLDFIFGKYSRDPLLSFHNKGQNSINSPTNVLDFTFWKYSRGPLPSSCSLLVTMVRDQSTVKLICCILYFGNIQGASLLSFRNNWKYSRGPLPSSCSLLVTMVRSLLTDTSILLPHHHLPLLNPHLHPRSV